jgi:hypothetical protein
MSAGVGGTELPLPGRLGTRPDREDWGLDDLLTLPEAAALYWPDGPVTVSTLRTAIRRGQLPVARLGRRFLTSRRAIEEMTRDEVRIQCGPGTRGHA